METGGGDGSSGQAEEDAAAQKNLAIASAQTDETRVFFDIEKCRKHTLSGEWRELDDYLCTFLKEAGSNSDAPSAHKKHPNLLLIPRREMVLSRLRENKIQDATADFSRYVEPLLGARSTFVPYPYIREEVERLRKLIKSAATRGRDTGEEDREIIVSKILDYIRLYFRRNLRAIKMPPRVENKLWAYAVVIEDANGQPKKTGKDNRIVYECLACRWGGGSTSGIRDLRNHFMGALKRRKCRMLTEEICLGIDIPIPPELIPDDGSPKGKRKRNELDDLELEGRAAAAPTASSALITYEAPAAPQAGFICPRIIRPELHAMHDLLRQLLGMALFDVSPSRTWLDSMRRTCDNAVQSNGMVDARELLGMIGWLRDEVLKIHGYSYEAIDGGLVSPAILQLFGNLFDSLTRLEHACLAACMDEPVPAPVHAAPEERDATTQAGEQNGAAPTDGHEDDDPNPHQNVPSPGAVDFANSLFSDNANVM